MVWLRVSVWCFSAPRIWPPNETKLFRGFDTYRSALYRIVVEVILGGLPYICARDDDVQSPQRSRARSQRVYHSNLFDIHRYRVSTINERTTKTIFVKYLIFIASFSLETYIVFIVTKKFYIRNHSSN